MDIKTPPNHIFKIDEKKFKTQEKKDPYDLELDTICCGQASQASFTRTCGCGCG